MAIPKCHVGPFILFLFSQHLALALAVPLRMRVTQNISVCAQMPGSNLPNTPPFHSPSHLLNLSCQAIEADCGPRAAARCPGSLKHIWTFPCLSEVPLFDPAGSVPSSQDAGGRASLALGTATSFPQPRASGFDSPGLCFLMPCCRTRLGELRETQKTQ